MANHTPDLNLTPLKAIVNCLNLALQVVTTVNHRCIVSFISRFTCRAKPVERSHAQQTIISNNNFAMNTIDQFCRNTKGVQFLQRRFEVLQLLSVTIVTLIPREHAAIMESRKPVCSSFCQVSHGETIVMCLPVFSNV